MAVPSSHEITVLLRAWRHEDEASLKKLVPLAEAELHRLPHHCLVQERPAHTLQTKALANEAYLRLINWKSAELQVRSHFCDVGGDRIYARGEQGSPWLYDEPSGGRMNDA